MSSPRECDFESRDRTASTFSAHLPQLLSHSPEHRSKMSADDQQFLDVVSSSV